MKISYNWLQDYFEDTLPSPQTVGEILTNHAFEIESIDEVGEDTCLDVKVLPDRSHDALSHRGIALELALQGKLKLKKEKTNLVDITVPESNCFKVEIQNLDFCKRFSALVIENVEVKESPVWLQDRLKTIGQRSINNVVDATNYVMFGLGQPLHAYDRALLQADGPEWRMVVRNAEVGESLTALDGKEYALSPETVVIGDGNSGKALGIAGVKGGKASEITKNTKDIVLEAANFNAVSVRKTAKKVGLRTDASVRFENEITPELTTLALKMVADLIMEIAGTENTHVEGMVDIYERKSAHYKVGVSVSEVQNILGIPLSKDSIEDILKRRGYEYLYIENPRKIFVETALTLAGTKYTLGASVLRDAPREFDCSGLVAYCATQVGITVPRISVDQYFFSTSIPEDEVMPGDLLFALTPGGGMHTHSKEWMPGLQIPEGVDHVAIMLSKTDVFHTSRHNPEGARKETLEEFMKIRTLRGYKRIPSIDEPRFVVTIPPERLDIRIREDLVKEIGRTYGYETLEAKKIEPLVGTVAVERIDYYSNVIRDTLTGIGFSEVMTYAFQNSGEVELQNPLASDKAFLRNSLVLGLSQSREMNMHNIDLLGLSQVTIFEIGNVFTETSEYLSLGVTIGNPKGFKVKDGDVTIEKVTETLCASLHVPVQFEEKDGVYTLNLTNTLSQLPDPETPLIFGEFPQTRFKRYSEYPAILRDIAVFIPEGQSEMEIIDAVKKEAGDLLVNYRLFDTFTKDFPEGKKTSYAYRLVFQSMDRTLTDAEITPMMEKVTIELNSKTGFQVR